MDESTQLQVFRELGSMDARIGNIEKDVGEIKISQKEMAGVLAQLVDMRSQQKGGKTALASVGVGGVSIGGLIVAAAQWLGIGVKEPPPPVIIQPAPIQQPAPADRPVNSAARF